MEEAAVQAIKAEVKQLFKDLSALQPVQAEMIITGACVLTCHMFLVEKFLANGDFDKMKARLVSHGNKQNKEDFPDRSSPTVAIHSVMMVLALFAGQMMTQTVCKIDVKGAFVQTPMEG
jgi:glucose-6-phosphate-specific signal transduction histidine kinase